MEVAHLISLPAYPLGFAVVSPPCSCSKEEVDLRQHLERDWVQTRTGGGPWLLVQGLVDTLGSSPFLETLSGCCSSSEESS